MPVNAELRWIQDNLASFAQGIEGESADRDTGPQARRQILTNGSRTLVYGKNDPFRSRPISANELEEVTMGSQTNV